MNENQVTIAGIVYTVEDIPLKLADDALAVQSACNLSGIVHSMSADAKVIFDLPNARQGTDWRNHHPVMILYAAQIAHLTTGEAIVTWYFESTDICRRALEWHKSKEAKNAK